MRIFKIPFDIKREERIFGGYLSLRQVLYLILATSSLGILATQLHLAVKIAFISIISIFFMLCCFLKIGEQNFDKFCFYAAKYLFRKKNFIYRRCCK